MKLVVNLPHTLYLKKLAEALTLLDGFSGSIDKAILLLWTVPRDRRFRKIARKVFRARKLQDQGVRWHCPKQPATAMPSFCRQVLIFLTETA
jgi:hypothetical protein